MTTQEHAPVVPVEQTGAAAPAPHAPAEHPVVAHLRTCLARAEAHADEIAGRGGHERELVELHMARAAQCDEDAMNARSDVDTWKVLLERAIAEVGTRQTPAAPTPQPIAAAPDFATIHCNRCGRPYRPATPEEQAAAQAGHGMPDVRRECPTCLLNVAAPERPEERAR